MISVPFSGNIHIYSISESTKYSHIVLGSVVELVIKLTR